jgi:hypothetical protein
MAPGGFLYSLRRLFRLILGKKPTIFGPEDASLAHSTFLFVSEIEKGGKDEKDSKNNGVSVFHYFSRPHRLRRRVVHAR